MTLLATSEPSPTHPIGLDWEQRSRALRVLVVDEFDLIQTGLRALLTEAPWVESCLVAGSADAALQVARRHQPQLVLVSTSLGGQSGPALCRTLTQRMPLVKVVLMTGEGRVPVGLALSLGAVAAVSKQMSRQAIVAAIRDVSEGARVFPREPAIGECQLSKRETDVLLHIATGLSNKEVAAVLNLSRHTVKQHTSAVYKKLGVRNRAEAASRAQGLGLMAAAG